MYSKMEIVPPNKQLYRAIRPLVIPNPRYTPKIHLPKGSKNWLKSSEMHKIEFRKSVLELYVQFLKEPSDPRAPKQHLVLLSHRIEGLFSQS